MLLLKAGKEHLIVFSVAFFITFIWKQCKGILTCTHKITLHLITLHFQCRNNGLGMEITLTKADKWFLYHGKASLLRENKKKHHQLSAYQIE